MKKSNCLLLALLLVLLTGCSLARAEEAPDPETGDRWAGFLVVPVKEGNEPFYNNPYREEYGSVEADTEFGTLNFPRDVLFAVEDENRNYTFPGMENVYNLFHLEEEDEHGHVSRVVSNMDAHENGIAMSYLDEGTEITLSGTVYCGPPLGVTDWDPHDDGTIWQFYRVYQTADGRVYTNGCGDSTNGPMTYTASETRSSTENGDTVQEESLSVAVTIEAVPRLEKLTVTQFDENNTILRSDELALRDDLPEITPDPAAAWILIEEASSDGTARTLYNVPAEDEDPITHTVVLLNDEGFGHLTYLTIQ